MTEARRAIAKKIHTLHVLLLVLGILGTLGFVAVIFDALSGENPNSTLALYGIAYCVALWIGLGWMMLVSEALAELLVPTEKP